MKVFGSGYARVYDATYSSKDYEQECDFLEAAFARFSERPVRSVLDLGCGTGGHAIRLASRGYRVHGLDRSLAMIDLARDKAVAQGVSLDLSVGDLKSTHVGGQFDAVVMMFAVLGYQTANNDVVAALRNTRDHLRAGGLLIFDVWYGVPVLMDRPTERIRVLADNGREIIRAVSPTLREERSVVDVRIRVWELEKDRLVASADENHEMRYFFPVELEQFLRGASFRLAATCAFPQLDAPLDPTNWNLGCVAVAV